MSRTPVIETSGLVMGYAQKGKKRKIIHDALQLQLFAGELTSLLGLNGAGKSTLLRTLCGFQPVLGGVIRLNGRLLSEYSQAEQSRMIGVVLTEKTNAGGITVQELVAFGRHPYTGFFGKLKSIDKQIVAESLASVGMTHKASHFVSELSDGERQKAMIAKALAQQCPIILLDEPTAFLDVTSRMETMSLLHRLAVEQQKAILLSTHDLDLAIQMSDRLWLLANKRTLECGTPEDLILCGSFETFFKKGHIAFDVSTGKLTAAKPLFPIAVEGDANTAYWVGNALIRNGLRPSAKGEANDRIYCHSPNQISLFLGSSSEIKVGSVAELIAVLANQIILQKYHSAQ
jgi:iron complex transport system ATP-binding protein